MQDNFWHGYWLKLAFQDVASPRSSAIAPHCLSIVEDGEALGPLHVLKCVVRVSKDMLRIKINTFCVIFSISPKNHTRLITIHVFI